jgi:hypothetical protein
MLNFNGYIRQNLEDSITKYYMSSSLSASIDNFYAANNSEETKQSPAIITEVGSASELFIGSGIWVMPVIVQQIYPYENTGSVDSKNLSYKNFMAVTYTASFAESVISSSNNTIIIYDVQNLGENGSIQENHWIDEIQMQITAVSQVES